MLTISAKFNGSKITGTRKLEADINFAKKVENVDSQTLLLLFMLASSETCIPKESDSASAIAIIIIPPITIVFEFVLEISPVNNPSVVIIPDTSPKLNPFFIDSFIIIDAIITINS